MYDLHNHLLLKNSIEYLDHFNLKGIGVVFSDKFDQKKFTLLKKRFPKLDLVPVVEIHAEQQGDVTKKVSKFRNQVDIILVHAKDQRAVRAAAENSDVDIIAHAFVDQTAAREAGKNNVAIEINLKDMLSVYGMKRSILNSKLKFNLDLARKYKIPIVLSTGAQSIYDMRNPKQIVAFAECLGLTHLEAKKAVFETPKQIVETNRAKRTGEKIGKVKVVK